MSDRLLIRASLATFAIDDVPYGLIEDGGLVVADGKIAWLGRGDDLPARYGDLPVDDLEGRVITPGLIDCHTHVVYGGNRAKEFELRLNGASYEQLADAGGGIVSTVAATRAASDDELLCSALKRVDALIAEGVTTIEVKSGYGLDQETELRMLRVARAISDARAIEVETTFLGAHAVPPEFLSRPDAYLDEVCLPTLRAAHEEGLVDAVDGFCEGIGFSVEQIRQLFSAAKAMNLPVKLHAEQLSNLGGAALSAQFNALSADHLEYVDEAGVVAMADANTSAVLLPGAFYTLREAQLPPVELLRKHRVPIAVATDCNPGSSPLSSILIAMNMGCTLFRLTPEEALAGVTREAAKALGKRDRGTLAVGKRADLAIWNVEHPTELPYRIGFNPLHRRILGDAS